MVSPISAATQGLISSGSHFPLAVSIQGLLIFAIVPVSGGRNSGGGFGEDQEEEHGGGRFRRQTDQQTENEEIFAIINAFLATQ